MRAVLDEGVPRALAKALGAVGTAVDPFPGTWAGLKNGALIRIAETAGYTVLVSNDKNMGFQQNLTGRTIAIVALPLNRRRILLERVDDIVDTIRQAQPGCHLLMKLDGTRVSHRITRGEAVTETLPPVPTFET